MRTWLIGPGLVATFALSQAFRDVYLAGVFQGVDVFAVIALAFSISTLIFAAVTVTRERVALSRMRGALATIAWMNVTTALAWTSYFYGLKHLQPSIVNALHSGMGPLTVLVLARTGAPLAGASRPGRADYACGAALAVALAVLWWVVLSGASGLPAQDTVATLAGLALLIVSGASITISLLLSKRLNDRGLGPNAVSAVRYPLIILIAFAVLAAGARPTGIAGARELAILALTATVLIVLPLYSLQVGIAHTRPLTAQVIRALGPVFIFALELADRRVVFAGPALAGIALYSLAAIGGTMAQTWRRPARSKASQGGRTDGAARLRAARGGAAGP